METTLYDVMGEIIHLATEALINDGGHHKSGILSGFLKLLG